MPVARVSSRATRRLLGSGWVGAAIALGTPPYRIAWQHLLPIAGVLALVEFRQAVILEATLSYLGAGIQPPAASWGNMLSGAQLYLNGVVKLDATGHVLARWGSPSTSSSSQPGQFSNPVGIATDSQNNVYVSDVFNHRVEKFDSAGKFLSEWGVEGQADGTFSPLDGYNGVGLQFGLAIDREDNIFVSDTKNTRVQKFH